MKQAHILFNDYARVETSPEDQLIKVTWLQHTSGPLFREVLQVALQHARTQGLSRWLNDMRRLSYVTMADQVWTAREFLPALDHRLHQRSACVVSPQRLDLIPDTLLQEALRQEPLLAQTVELRVFLHMETARCWLLR